MNIYVFVKELNPDGCLYRFTKVSIKNCLICEQQKICLQLYNVFFLSEQCVGIKVDLKIQIQNKNCITLSNLTY